MACHICLLSCEKALPPFWGKGLKKGDTAREMWELKSSLDWLRSLSFSLFPMASKDSGFSRSPPHIIQPHFLTLTKRKNDNNTHYQLACENIRFSALFAAGTFRAEETSPAAKSVEKRMFSQANYWVACENIHFSSLFAAGEERGETDVFAS